MFCTSFLSRKTNLLDFRGFIRALLSIAINIMSVQVTLASRKDQLTPAKSGTYFFSFFHIMFVYSVLPLFLVLGICLDFFALLCFVFCFCFCFFLCCFYVFFFCFCFLSFGLSFSALRHFPSVFYFFFPIADISYKYCVKHFGRLQ